MKKLKNLEESSGKYQWYHSIEIADGVYTKSTIPHFKEKWDFNLSAIVHHLVFKQKESFETIVEKIARYTDRWLPIEFIPKEDKYVWKYFERWPDYHKTVSYTHLTLPTSDLV